MDQAVASTFMAQARATVFKTYNIEGTSDSSPDTSNFGTKLLTTRNTSDYKPNGGFVAYALDPKEQQEFLNFITGQSNSRTFNSTIACMQPVQTCKIGPVTPYASKIFCVSALNPNNSTNNKLSISIDFTTVTSKETSIPSVTSKGRSIQSSPMALIIISLVIFYYLNPFFF
ncbi:8638_t:CDS:2 [Cetraspora pellucida]|uniref:8638_t:CDS:1 n=1 Tax=Cetraspora pellucida TaxID=1433469 RepID=A0A9N9F183_9GLOM|nr:8638_t:CDS:2 [Cetraspora pellucida]